MIKGIMFDLDNTLIDFMKMKKISCEEAISAMIGAGLPLEKEKALKILFDIYQEVGMEDKTIFQKFLKKTLGKIDWRILGNGIAAYRRVHTSFYEPYPHVITTLYNLKMKNIKLAIVSDAPRLKVWIRLASMKIDHFFDVVVTNDDSKVLKPNPLPFKMALKQLKLKPKQCLMVGDNIERDINGAKKLGIKTCFAKYGNPKIKKSGADCEIGDVKELLDIV